MMQNLEQARLFAELICGEPDPVVFIQTFDDASIDGRKKRPELTEQKYGRLSEIEQELVDLNNRGAGIFMTINQTSGKSRKAVDVEAVRALFVDKDDGEITEPLHQEPSIRVRTKNGEHAYWILKAPAPKSGFRDAQEELIQKYRTDPSIKDLSRVMRLPGFVHRKDPSSPFLVHVSHASEKKYDLKEIVTCKTEHKSTPVKRAAKKRAVVSEGGRHTHLVSVMGSLRGKGFDKERALTALLVENQTWCQPPLCLDEVAQIVDSMSERSVDEILRYSPHSDLGNADRLAAFFGGQIAFHAQNKRWMIFDGKRFVEDRKFRIYSHVKAMLQRAREIGDGVFTDKGDSLEKHLRTSQSRAKIDAMLDLARGLLSRDGSEFDTDPYLLNLRNGTLNLRDGQLRQHSAQDLISKCSPVHFDPNAKCPAFLGFLSEITAGSDELQSYLQTVFGYSLIGIRNVDQCFWIFLGRGDNGKTTLIEIMKRVLGEYAASTSTTSFTLNKGNSTRNDLARLAGARLVAAAETQEGTSLDESLVKQITGGDPIQCRYLYGEFFEYIPTWKIIFAVNHLPQINGSDHGIWKRIKVVPFDVQISKEKIDRKLLEKLESEISGILNWAIEGCLEWQRSGFVEPRVVKEQHESYRENEDVIDDFLKAFTVCDADAAINATDLFKSFAREQKEMGQIVMSQKSFGQKMKAKEFPRKRSGPGGRWEYIGLRLKAGGRGGTEPTE